ncbi:MAG: polysaccharide biosynthesis C-terminal domain-containing protein [Flammeovirgaceae bacterium]
MFKKLLSETVLYGTSTILARLVNYLLVPLHTGAMPTESYGIVSEFYAMAALLNVVYTYGMETAFFRFSSKKENSIKEVYQNTLNSLIISSFIFSSIFIIFSNPIASFLGYPESSSYVVWFAFLIAIDAIVSIPFAKLRQEHKAQKFVFLKLMNVFVNVGLNYFYFWFCPKFYHHPIFGSWFSMVYSPEIGLGYAFLSNLIANALFIPLLWKEFAQWQPQINWKLYKEMILYAYPLLLGGIAYTINETMDRLLIKYWLPAKFYEGMNNLDAVGIYSGCYKLSIFISLAIQGYRYAAEPFFFNKVEDKNSPKIFALTTHYFIIVCCMMMLVVCANINWLSEIFLRNKAYKLGLTVVPFLLMANIMLGIYFNLSVWYKTTDKTIYGAYISGIGALITLILNYLLIPLLGYLGSAITTLACYSSMTTLCYILGQKHQPIPYKTVTDLIYLFITMIVSWMYFYLNFDNQSVDFIIKNMSILSLILIIFFFEKNKFLKNKKHFIIQIIKKNE